MAPRIEGIDIRYDNKTKKRTITAKDKYKNIGWLDIEHGGCNLLYMPGRSNLGPGINLTLILAPSPHPDPELCPLTLKINPSPNPSPSLTPNPQPNPKPNPNPNSGGPTQWKTYTILPCLHKFHSNVSSLKWQTLIASYI
jgi:hypothetical protein